MGPTTGRHTLVIGVGNTLRGDDGVGVRIADELSAGPLPKDVTVLDGGTGGLDLLLHFEGAERVILIDAAQMGREPGQVRVFGGERLGQASDVRFASTHGFGVAEVLALGRSLGVQPDVTVVGIQPESVVLRDGLSETLAARMPEYLQLTRGLLAAESERSTGSHMQSKE